MADFNTLEEVISSGAPVLSFYYNSEKKSWIPVSIFPSSSGFQFRWIMPQWMKANLDDTNLQTRELLAKELIISKITFETVITRNIASIEIVEWCKSIYIGGHNDSPFWIRKNDEGKSLRDRGVKVFDTDAEKFFRMDIGVHPGGHLENRLAERGYCIWIFSLVYPDEATLLQCLPSVDQILRRK